MSQFFRLMTLGLFAAWICMGVAGCESNPTAVATNPNYTDGDSDRDRDTSDLPSETETDGDGEAEEEGNPNDLPVDVVLGAGEVRAGHLKDGRGSLASCGGRVTGSDGDIKIYNNRVAFVINATALDHALKAVFAGKGGSVIDAVRLNENGTCASSDWLDEAAPVVGQDLEYLPMANTGTIRQVRAESVQVVHNGKDGEPARVRVRGIDWPVMGWDRLAYPDPNESYLGHNFALEFAIDYVLAPDSDLLRVIVSTTAEGNGGDDDSELFREPSTPGLAVLADESMIRFYPGMTLDGVPTPEKALPPASKHGSSYGAFLSQTLSYGVSAQAPQGVMWISPPAEPAFIFANSVISEVRPEVTLYFAVGTGSSSSVFETIRTVQEQNGLSSPTARFEGQLDQMWPEQIRLQKDKVLAVALRSDETTNQIPQILGITWLKEDDTGHYPFQMILPAAAEEPAISYQLTSTTLDLGEYAALPLSVTALKDQAPTAGLTIPIPPRPGVVTLSVKEHTDTGDLWPVAARVEFYYDHVLIGEPPPAAQWVATYLHPAQSVSAEYTLPLTRFSCNPACRFTYLVSAGPDFTYAMGNQTYQLAMPEGVPQGPGEIVLERVTPSALGVTPWPVGADEESAEGSNLQVVSFIPADLGARSSDGLTTRVSRATRELDARTAHLSFAAFAEDNSYRVRSAQQDALWLASGVEIAPAWSHLAVFETEAGSQPWSRPRHESIPFNDYAPDTGDFNNRSSLSYLFGGFLSTTQPDYDGRLAYVVRHPSGPTGEGASLEPAFFDFFHFDPAQGLESLPLEVRNTLSSWQALEILNSRMGWTETYRAVQGWLSLLAHGYPKAAVASSEADGLIGSDGSRLGWPRTLIINGDLETNPTPSTLLQWALESGQSVVTSGPFLFPSVGDTLPGQTLLLSKEQINPEFPSVPLRIQAVAPAWVPMADLYVCVNGRLVSHNLLRIEDESGHTYFNGTINVPLPLLPVPASPLPPPAEGGDLDDEFDGDEGAFPEDGDLDADPEEEEPAEPAFFADTWIVVFVMGPRHQDLSPVMPGMGSVAISNPIFIADVTDSDATFTPFNVGAPYCVDEATWGVLTTAR